QNLPPYPDAQQVKTEGGMGGTRTISFQTDDQPIEVCKRYKDILAQDWWGQPSCQSVLGTVTANFEWVQADINGPTDLGYRLTLVATPTEIGRASCRVTGT